MDATSPAVPAKNTPDLRHGSHQVRVFVKHEREITMLNSETCSITVTNERMPLRKRKNKERTYYLSYTLHGMQYNRNTKTSSWHNVLTAAQVGEIEAHVVGWVTQSLEDQKEEGDGKCEVAAVDSDMDVDGTAAVPVELTRFRVVAPASGRPLPPPPPPQRAAPPSVTRTPILASLIPAVERWRQRRLHRLPVPRHRTAAAAQQVSVLHLGRTHLSPLGSTTNCVTTGSTRAPVTVGLEARSGSSSTTPRLSAKWCTPSAIACAP